MSESRSRKRSKGELGNISFDSATPKGHIIPDLDNGYDIGSAEFKVRDMYVSDNSLWIGDTHKISIQNGKMKFRKRKTSSVPAGISTAGGNSAAALLHASKGSLELMTSSDWLSYRRSFNPDARIEDVFAETDFDDEDDIATVNGLQAALDAKLNASSAFVLPTSSTTVLGGVKVGANLSISNSVLAGAAPYSKPSAEPISYITGLQTALNTKTTPAYVDTKVASLVASAPATLDTLNELAAALGDDANHVTTMTNLVATKLSLTGGTLSGNLVLPTGSGTTGGLNLPTINSWITGGGHRVLQVDATMTYLYGGSGGGQIRTANNASSLVQWLDNGSVGIGTASPSAKFEVEDNGTSTGNVLAKFTIDDQGSHYGLSLGNDSYSTTDSNGLMLHQMNDGTGQIYNAGTPIISLSTTGNVEMGGKLDVTTASAGFASTIQNTNAASDSNGLLIKAGTTANEYALKVSNPTDSTTYMTVKGNGNVGIGTAVPSDGDLTINTPKLHVKGTNSSGSFELMARFQAQSDADNSGSSIALNHSNDRGILIEGGRSTLNRSHGAIKSIDNIGRLSDVIKIQGGNGRGVNYISLFTGEDVTTTERLRIDSSGRVLVGISGASGFGQLETTTFTTEGQCILARVGGNVGIGTSSPDNILHVYKEASISSHNYTNYPLKIESKDTGGDFWNNQGVGIQFENTASSGSFISAEIVGETSGADGTKGELVFKTSTSSTPAERMRITSTGNVEMGGDLDVTGRVTSSELKVGDWDPVTFGDSGGQLRGEYGQLYLDPSNSDPAGSIDFYVNGTVAATSFTSTGNVEMGGNLTISGKNVPKVFNQNAAPTSGFSVGDIWYDDDDDIVSIAGNVSGTLQWIGV